MRSFLPISLFAAEINIALISSSVKCGVEHFFLAVILVITLPDYSAILTVGMPDLGTVPLSALSAAYLAGEKVDTAVRAPTLLSALQFLLNQFKHLRLNDGLVISLHIVLRDFALVDLFASW